VISTSDNQLQAGVDNQGWVDPLVGNNNPVNDNYFTGNGHRSYFIFDLSSIVDTIISATLEVRRYETSSPGTIEFFDVSTPAASLVATRGASPQAAIAADLSSGTSYGSFAIGFGSSTDILSFALSATVLADLNAATGYFAIGGHATSGGPFFLNSFAEPGNSAGTQNSIQRLVLVTAAPQVVPEPTSLLLLGTGASVLLAKTRQRKRQQLQ
jgi:hypothetical protein